ncbi:outer membrane protein assembly factor BamB [Imhoffiella purpurea]|uniref:Outer membrane protein assembly factor BamB n=1 Tax=Imhoffiella purpurea TaxID=1249627 RepID=W9VCD1_9GAMM|nr:outer membrane protein assembly factor BamB [Imhoffiella purpurea]EXJ14646.1 Outer membrane protein YfgL [Imhoffiella purpurea]
MRPQLRSLSSLFGTLLLAGMLSGCGVIPWLGKEKDPTPPTKLTDIVQAVSIDRVWSERPTRGSDGRRLYLVPGLSGGRLYLADARGRLVALAADTGREIWKTETKLDFSGGPDVSGDALVLGTSRGELVAFATADGKERWRTALDSEVLSEPRFIGDGLIVVHTLDDSIFGIEAATGKQLWRTNYPAPVLTLRGSSSPVVAPSGIVVGLSGGKLVMLDPKDGIPLWEVIVTRPSGRSELARIADIDADPVLFDGILYVGSYNGDLAAVDAASGEVLWRRDLSAHAGLAADRDGLFVTDSEDQVWGADLTDGAGRWKQEQLRYRRLTAPTLVGNLIAVGDLDGYLHLLDTRDGRLVGRIRITKSGITARPLLADGRLYVYAEDGTITALRIGPTAPAKPAIAPSAANPPTDAAIAPKASSQAP